MPGKSPQHKTQQPKVQLNMKIGYWYGLIWADNVDDLVERVEEFLESDIGERFSILGSPFCQTFPHLLMRYYQAVAVSEEVCGGH